MGKQPLTPDQLAAICREIDEEMRELVAAQESGRINENGFVEALLKFETERAAAHGLILTASHTFDDWTVICLRLPHQRTPCASFEFNPATGHFRHVGTPCRELDPSRREQVVD